MPAGAMYCFVFLWTPVLEGPRGSVIPHGMIFACFMASSMVGSLRSEAILHGRNVVRWAAAELEMEQALRAACFLPALLASSLS